MLTEMVSKVVKGELVLRKVLKVLVLVFLRSVKVSGIRSIIDQISAGPNSSPLPTAVTVVASLE